MVEIKVLGGGCANCVKLENNVKQAIEELNIEAEIIKVKDIAKIMEFGVMSTPALVINDEVVRFGEITPVKEIVEILREYN